MSSESIPPCELPPRFPANTETPDLQVGFERTSIGDMPIDWVVNQLSNHWEVIDCKHITADFIPSGIPVVSIGEVQGRFVDIERAKHTTPSFYFRLIEGGRKPRPGDLILSRNATVGEVAQVAHWHPPFAMGQDVCLLRKRFPDYSSNFLQSVFQSDIISRQLNNLMVGSTFRRVNVRQVKGLVIPFPGSVEQRAIAEALSDVDELLEALEALIAKKWAIKQATMQQLLTGKTRLPGFHGEWIETNLGAIGECVIGLTYKPENVVDYGLLVLRASNIQNGRLTYDDNVYVNVAVPDRLITQTGDVLVCVRNGSRALIGKCAVISDGAAGLTFGAFMSVYRTKHWQFLAHAFQGQDIQRQIRDNIGATINQITNKDMKALRIKLPCEDEQIAIADVLSNMDAEITALEVRRDKTRAIKQGMMQQLLTGRIRLVKPQSAEADA